MYGSDPRKAARCTLRPGGPFPRMAWRSLPPGIYRGFWESYKTEIAAYEIDKLLKLDMVPPSVERQLARRRGCRPTLGGEHLRGEGRRPTRRATARPLGEPAGSDGHVRQPHWQPRQKPGQHAARCRVECDSARSFARLRSRHRAPAKMRRIDAAFWARIESLTRPQLDAALRAWIGEHGNPGHPRPSRTNEKRDQVAAEIAAVVSRARARSEHASWPMITKTIAHYEILAPIGEGGMGVVYRALDTRLGRPVAVKLLSPEGADRRRASEALRPGSESRLRAESPAHHYDLRHRSGRGRSTSSRWSTSPARHSPRRSHRAGCRIGDALQYAVADRRRAGGRARRRDPSSRPQAGQHHARHGWRQAGDQGSRFRAREADRVRRLQAHRRASLHGDAQARPIASRPRKGRSSARPPTCRPNRRRANLRTRGRMSSRFGAVLYEMITGRRAFSGATKISTLAAILTTEPEPPSQADPWLLARSRETACSAACERARSDAGSRWRI